MQNWEKKRMRDQLAFKDMSFSDQVVMLAKYARTTTEVVPDHYAAALGVTFEAAKKLNDAFIESGGTLEGQFRAMAREISQTPETHLLANMAALCIQEIAARVHEKAWQEQIQ
jgi:hypothetical protein